MEEGGDTVSHNHKHLFSCLRVLQTNCAPDDSVGLQVGWPWVQAIGWVQGYSMLSGLGWKGDSHSVPILPRLPQGLQSQAKPQKHSKASANIPLAKEGTWPSPTPGGEEAYIILSGRSEAKALGEQPLVFHGHRSSWQASRVKE